MRGRAAVLLAASVVAIAACVGSSYKAAVSTTTTAPNFSKFETTTTTAKGTPDAVVLPTAPRGSIDPDAGFVGPLRWVGRCFAVGGTPVVWLPGYKGRTGPLRVVDEKGKVVGRIGERIFIHGSLVPATQKFLALVQPPELRDCISKGPVLVWRGDSHPHHFVWWL
jgi:hypothetical protein